MSEPENICMELVFSKGVSASRRAKVMSFWKFLDAQDDIFPYRPTQGRVDSESTSATYDPEPESDQDPEQASQKRRIWYDELRIFHQLGLDRTALAADNVCKECLSEARTRDCAPDLADSVPEPYEEVAADVKAFGKRMKSRKGFESVRAYDMPEKYQHLMP